MKHLVYSNGDGFTCSDEKIRIFHNGLPFYFFDNKLKKKVHFNLPQGVFNTDNELKKVNFRLFKKKVLPPKERNLKVSKINFEYGENPNKCTIEINLMTGSANIKMDYSFKKMPYQIKCFILFHEIGHLFYKTEKYCDFFAYNKMIEKGFNPSQILFVSDFTIEKDKKQRFKCLKQWIKKN